MRGRDIVVGLHGFGRDVAAADRLAGLAEWQIVDLFRD